MRKCLYTVVLMGFTSATNVNGFNPMDKYFAEFEIVDENYRYVDLDSASAYLVA